MRNSRAVAAALSLALLDLLCAPAESAPRARATIIKVLTATYGGNCPGVAKGNATPFVSAACADDNLCNYRVYYRDLGGDPAPGCAKDFKVTYMCGHSTKQSTCEIPAEAGKGGEDGYPNEFCLLHCLSTRAASSNEKSDSVEKSKRVKARDASPARLLSDRSPVYPESAEPQPYAGGLVTGFWR